MSLAEGKEIYKNGVIALQTEMLSKETDSFEYYAEQMANLTEAFIKTAKVTVAPNIPVSTTGTATAQSGTTTATGTGTLS